LSESSTSLNGSRRLQSVLQLVTANGPQPRAKRAIVTRSALTYVAEGTQICLLQNILDAHQSLVRRLNQPSEMACERSMVQVQEL
jgi:hypothetical protein